MTSVNLFLHVKTFLMIKLLPNVSFQIMKKQKKCFKYAHSDTLGRSTRENDVAIVARDTAIAFLDECATCLRTYSMPADSEYEPTLPPLQHLIRAQSFASSGYLGSFSRSSKWAPQKRDGLLIQRVGVAHVYFNHLLKWPFLTPCKEKWPQIQSWCFNFQIFLSFLMTINYTNRSSVEPRFTGN